MMLEQEAMVMSIDREELKRAVDMLPEEKLAILQRYMRMLQKSSLFGSEPFHSSNKKDPILNVIGRLSGEPLTSRQIEDELYGSNDPHV